VGEFYLRIIYLISVTFTVVGYGDPVSMPNLNDHPADYWFLYLCMLTGFLAYQQANAQLASFLRDYIASSQEISTTQAKTEIKERLEKYFIIHNSTFGTRTLSVRQLDEWNKCVEFIFDYNYRDIQSHEFFRNLRPGLQQDLLKQLLQLEGRSFIFLFCGFTSQGFDEQVHEKLVYQLISNTDCVYLNQSQMVVSHGEQFDHFYMVKRGVVKLFSKNYTYLSNVEAGGFFGEYNVLFGLSSQMFFQASCESASSHILLFKIEAKQLLTIISKDIGAFRHFHSLAVQKFKFFQKAFRIIEQRDLKEKTRLELLSKLRADPALAHLLDPADPTKLLRHFTLEERLEVQESVAEVQRRLAELEKPRTKVYDILKIQMRLIGSSTQDIIAFYEQMEVLRLQKVVRRTLDSYLKRVFTSLKTRKVRRNAIFGLHSSRSQHSQALDLRSVRPMPVTLSSESESSLELEPPEKSLEAELNEFFESPGSIEEELDSEDEVETEMIVDYRKTQIANRRNFTRDALTNSTRLLNDDSKHQKKEYISYKSILDNILETMKAERSLQGATIVLEQALLDKAQELKQLNQQVSQQLISILGIQQ